MAFQSYQVVGVKGFKGDVEGKIHDNCKIRVLIRVSERAGTELGYNVVEWPYGNEENYQKLKASVTTGAIKFPCQLELDVEDTSKGREVFGWKIPGAK